MKSQIQQSASAVLMVQPLSFGFDAQTAQTNTFQNEVSFSRVEVQRRVNDEFNTLAAGLRLHGVTVLVFHDTDRREKPNAVFPNNWLSMWPDGSVYLYPMATESRRRERSSEALEQLGQKFKVSRTIDLSGEENDGRYLESTGVIIFDHLHKVMYGCISERCDEGLFNEHARALGYVPVVFHAYDTSGVPIYHTNVMMSLQTHTAVVCAESIRDGKERALVVDSIRSTGRGIVEITLAQMTEFCGNVLELHNVEGERLLVMSQLAHDAFSDDQRRMLEKDKSLLPFSIPTIETIGGGSVRCMLAEVFLPEKASPSGII